MPDLPGRGRIAKGTQVSVETKKNQGTGRLTDGVVEEVLTASDTHPHGIKVRLQDGQVGRVKVVSPARDSKDVAQKENGELPEQAAKFVDLDRKEIPKIEDMDSEFKEFYQYNKIMDMRMDAPIKRLKYGEVLRRLGDYRINADLNAIEFQERLIAETNRTIHHIVADNPDIRLLTSIPGVGEYTALAIYAEIDGIERFSDSHKLCAYVGMVPSVRNSADIVHHGRITKKGSNMVRWLLGEAVHAHVRYAKDSDLAIFYKRIAKKRGTAKATVATGSKMLRVIYWMLKEHMEFVKCRG